MLVLSPPIIWHDLLFVFHTICNDKKLMGHIAHLRHQFKSINKYDYIITLIRIRNYPLIPLWELNGYSSSIEQTWIPVTHWRFVPGLVEIVEINIFTFLHVFSLPHNCLPLKKGMALLLNKLESPFPRMLCANLVEIGPLVLEKKILKLSQCIFAIS